ncbi:MAG: Ig-like domain-containing protein [Moraxellaceae bacterium]|nr:Ig-like domain-containing protein [Moraxellaceae bacterium]
MLALLASVVLTACDKDKDPILGAGNVAALRPTVTAVAPVNNSTGVPINGTVITADFSEPVRPLTGSASFVLSCVAPCVSPAGTVTLNPAATTATFALPGALAPFTLYTARIAGAVSISHSLAMASPYIWRFTTGAAPDTVRPSVSVTAPVTTLPGPTPGVPANTVITAVFDEDMAPASVTAAGRFTVTCLAPCVSPAGNVTYTVGSRTAAFIPSAVLMTGVTYTATITALVTDVAGNGLAGNQLPALPAASNYVWTFTTAVPVPPAPVTVVPLSIRPAANAITVCPGVKIKASFNVPSGLRMSDASLTATTFAITGPGPAFVPVTAGSVVLDGATGLVATFTPLDPLPSGVTYTVTLKGGATGVKDQAIPANTMASNFVWTFTTGPATGICLPPVNLGLLATFGVAATAGITNTPTVPVTTINGDVVLDPGATCNAVAIDAAGGFGLCGSNASTPLLNGTVISPLFPDAGATSGAIRDSLLAVYLSITPPAGPPAAGSLGGAINLPAGTTLGEPTGSALVQGDNLFAPGLYQSLTSLLITGDITLDAQGNPDAVFIFQSSSTVGTAAGAATPGPHTRILLINGAKAANVWWQAGTSATLGSFTEFNGNILSAADITMETGATSCGRLLAGAFTAGAFVFDSNVVSVPGNGCAP